MEWRVHEYVCGILNVQGTCVHTLVWEVEYDASVRKHFTYLCTIEKWKVRLTMVPSHGTKCPSYMGKYGLPITTASVTQSYYTPRNLLTTRTEFIGTQQPKIRLLTLSTTCH